MMDIQAALGLHQLARVETNLVRREAVWARYDAAFQDLPLILPTPPAPHTRHARHLYTLLIDIDAVDITRDEVLQALHRENIGTGVHYVALHLQPYYRETFGFAPDDYPNAHFVSERTLSIPFSTKLTDEDVTDVITAVHRVLHHARPRTGISAAR
jgi:dTDP-4-amino-4,6-dideoxygalactose transaminase